MADDKLLSSGKLPSTIAGGAANKDGSGGPTGSKRVYPNSGPTNSPKLPNATQFNPMNSKASTFGVGGV